MAEKIQRLKIWCLLRDQFAHVKPLETYLGDRAEFIYDATWDPNLLIANRPNLVLCVNEYPSDIARCLDAAREAKIPSLVLQDGCLEWRCLYGNPLYGAGSGPPLHQPVLADKIACIGYQSAYQIAAWGNPDKVEVTGMPRLDDLLNRPAPPIQVPGKRILIMTAKKPWFYPEQKELIVQALNDLKEFFQEHDACETVWRVTKNLEHEIGVENTLQELSTLELSEVLRNVDAVITTPSTAVLESMLLKRPVAVLDYHNVPRFVPTAWTISCRSHILSVVKELMHPPFRKIAFQDDCLRFCLRCDGPAATRVADLIKKMIEFSEKLKDSASGYKFPPKLINSKIEYPQSEPLALDRLYPDQPLFAETNLQDLQVRYARLFRENTNLKEEVEKNKLAFWMQQLYVFIVNFLAKRR